MKRKTRKRLGVYSEASRKLYSLETQTMLKKTALSIIASLTLSACANETVATKTTCDLEFHKTLVGTNIGEVTFPPGLTYRVLQEGDAATMDLNPQRLNVIVDDKGWIEGVSCS